MAGITQEKTWTIATADATNSNSTLNAQAILFAIKTNLLSNGFTVISSSNSSTSSASDNWSSSSDIVWSGLAHSWIVLEHSSGYQLCFDCNNTLVYRLDLVSSYSGSFSGGNTTDRPTASDELIVNTSTDWNHSDSADRKLVFVSDSTNSNYYILISRPNDASPFAAGFIMFGIPSGYDSSWTEPFYIGKYGTTINNQHLIVNVRSEGEIYSLYTLKAYYNTFVVDNNSSYYNDILALRVRLTSDYKTLVFGYLPDFYKISSAATQNDYISDGANTKRWIIFNTTYHYALPSDGTSITIDASETPTEYSSADLFDIINTSGSVKADGRSDIRQGSFFSFSNVGKGGVITSS